MWSAKLFVIQKLLKVLSARRFEIPYDHKKHEFNLNNCKISPPNKHNIGW